MNLTSSYYEAEKRYLTPSEMDSKTEHAFTGCRGIERYDLQLRK